VERAMTDADEKREDEPDQPIPNTKARPRKPTGLTPARTKKPKT
jgi:hypothetical protein